MRYILLHFTYHQSPIPRMQIICLIAVVAIAVFIAVFKILMYSEKIATETYSESSDKQSLFNYSGKNHNISTYPFLFIIRRFECYYTLSRNCFKLFFLKIFL